MSKVFVSLTRIIGFKSTMLKVNVSYDGQDKMLVLANPKVRHLQQISNLYRENEGKIDNVTALALFVEVLAVEFDGQHSQDGQPAITSDQFLDADAVSFQKVGELLAPFLSGFNR